MVTVAQITTPTTAEQNEALNIFNRLVRSVYGNEAGDPFVTVNFGNNNVGSNWQGYNSIPSDFFVRPDSRVVFNNTQPQTMYLNPYPQDGERMAIQDASGNMNIYPVTLLGNGNKIEGVSTLVLNTAGFNKEWLYRSDIGEWQVVTPLTLVSVLPFPEEFEDMFIIGLAMRINPRNGTSIDPQSVQAYSRILTQFKARYSVVLPQRAEEGLIRTLGVGSKINRTQGYGNNFTTNRFNVGYSF
jgi:hypothetical protein